MWLLTSFLISLAHICGAKTTETLPLIINTDKGPIRGFLTNSILSFTGIPYAQPPVGDKRWRAPEPSLPWTNIKETTTYSPACIQPPPDPGYTFPPDVTFSEDCLYLNVWAPNSTSLKPVMVWIHGGSYVNGGNSELRLRGDIMALSGNVVVVLINYRLGILGWLAHSAFKQDDPNRPSIGNYGLLDQMLALTWVQKNIKNFGGDPNAVTIMGESAGASSVCYHLTSPLSKGLFTQGILESSACFKEANNLLEAQQYANKFQQDLGCQGNSADVIKCLRSLSSDQILSYQNKNVLAVAVINKFELMEHPFVSIINNRINPVRSLLIGNVLNEGTIFLKLKRPISQQDYSNWLYAFFGTFTPLILSTYPCNASDCWYAATEALGDFSLVCPNYVIANSLCNSVPTFSFLFNHIPAYSTSGFGVFHSAEVPFVFSTLARVYPVSTYGETVLSSKMTTFWTNFAKTTNPNGNTGNTTWPQYTGNNGMRLLLKTENLGVIQGYKDKECSFWQTIFQLNYNY